MGVRPGGREPQEGPGKSWVGVWPSALNLLPSVIAGPLMDYLPNWQKIYFYCWG